MSKTTKRRAAARVRTGSAKGVAKVAAVRRDSHGRFKSSGSAPHASGSVPMNRAGRRQAAKASRAAAGGRSPRTTTRGLDSAGRLGRAS